MKARNPSTGTLDTVYVKALDSMPVGSQIEFTGDTIPAGWEEANDYSTTEIDTGKKWIDGSTIYRKTVVYDSTTGLGASFEIAHNVSNIGEHKVVVEAEFMLSNISYYGFETTSTSFINVYAIDATKIKGSIGSSWNNAFKKAYITIEYTKSS